MKSLRKAAAMLTAAVLGFGAMSIPASAADSEVPKWVPQDYVSALDFLNTYGATRVVENKVCLVLAEPVTNADEAPLVAPYVLNLSQGGKRELYREILLPPEGMEEGNPQLEVLAFAGVVEASFSCEFSPQPEGTGKTHTYSFYTDRDFKTVETDLYGWVPDSVSEFYEYQRTNGPISVNGRYIAFCIQQSAGTQYNWQEAEIDAEAAEKVLISSCTTKGTLTPPVDGGQSGPVAGGGVVGGASGLSVHVYQAKKDGPLTLGWYWGEQEAPKDWIKEDFEAVDDASVILRKGDAYFKLIDSETGEYLEIDPENPPVLNVRTETTLPKPAAYAADDITVPVVDPIEEIEPVDDPIVPIEYEESTYTLTENPMVLPIAAAYRNSVYGVTPKEGTEPKNYRCKERKIHSHYNGSCTVEWVYRYEQRGDVNFDAKVTMADLILMQRWLFGEKVTLMNWQAGDMNEDGKLDVRDMTLLKRALLETLSNLPHCRLEVVTTYGGTGIAGQDLGSGEFTEVFTVAEGDQFVDACEGQHDGHWIRNGSDYRHGPVMEISRITEEGVTFTAYVIENNRVEKKEITAEYNADPIKLNATFTVYDGINYTYQVRFSRYLPPMTYDEHPIPSIS